MEPHDLTRTLGRLLGPPQTEIGCDECFEQLDRYVELELELAGEDADTAIPGTHSIDYVVTGIAGLTSTTTRTVVVSAPANDNAASSTLSP